MILKFTSQSCTPCKQLSEALERLNLKKHIHEVDIDTDYETTAKWRIRGVPTMLSIESGDRLIGMKSDSDLLEFVENHLEAKRNAV